LTNDGTVDLIDLGYWTDYWLIDGSDTPGDLNRDTSVDLLDFALLTQQYLLQTAWYE
jgi:hypothetical protein